MPICYAWGHSPTPGKTKQSTVKVNRLLMYQPSKLLLYIQFSVIWLHIKYFSIYLNKDWKIRFFFLSSWHLQNTSKKHLCFFLKLWLKETLFCGLRGLLSLSLSPCKLGKKVTLENKDHAEGLKTVLRTNSISDASCVSATVLLRKNVYFILFCPEQKWFFSLFLL